MFLDTKKMSSTIGIDLINLRKPLKSNDFTINFNQDLFNAKEIDGDTKKKLDDRWEKLIEDKSSGRVLFNQSKFRLHSTVWSDENSSKLTLNLGLTDYKSFICTQQQNLTEDLRQSLTEDHLAHPLGVGCCLITADDCFVLIKRGSRSIDFPNIFDIPGGHPEPQ